MSICMCLFLTSGVSVLRCEMNAGTDMMWRRKDLSRLSEKCAAITGLKHTSIRRSSHYGSLHRNRATDVIRLWGVSESKASSHGNRPEWQRKNGREGSFGKGRSGSCQSICKQNLQTTKMYSNDILPACDEILIGWVVPEEQSRSPSDWDVPWCSHKFCLKQAWGLLLRKIERNF